MSTIQAAISEANKTYVQGCYFDETLDNWLFFLLKFALFSYFHYKCNISVWNIHNHTKYVTCTQRTRFYEIQLIRAASQKDFFIEIVQKTKRKLICLLHSFRQGFWPGRFVVYHQEQSICSSSKPQCVFILQLNLSVTTTSIIKFITWYLFNNVF